MNRLDTSPWLPLDLSQAVWNHFFMVAPLVVIGTKEGDQYNLAPKHMVTALGHDNYFGFVCTPKHATYHNVRREKAFTVSFINPNQVVLASLAATPRMDSCDHNDQIIQSLPTKQAEKIDALSIADAYVLLECELDRIIDDFGDFSLIAGKIIYAQIHERAKRVSEKDDAELIHNNPLLAYLAYGRFAEIKETNAFPFPKDFTQEVLLK